MFISIMLVFITMEMRMTTVAWMFESILCTVIVVMCVVLMRMIMIVVMMTVAGERPHGEANAGQNQYHANDVTLLRLKRLAELQAYQGDDAAEHDRGEDVPHGGEQTGPAVRNSDQRCVRATTASGTQWSGRIECRKPTVPAASSRSGMDVACMNPSSVFCWKSGIRTVG
jgi:hypothetical protein